jgi:hypothetical protein
LSEELNPFARGVATAWLAAHRSFGKSLCVLDQGHFQASLPAPAGSQAGALVVCTANNNDIWVHLAPPQMWYAIDDEEEMLSVVEQFLSDSVLFVRVLDRDGAWLETTLMRASDELTVREGEHVVALSWSGSLDRP